MGLPQYTLEDYPESYDQLLQLCVNRLLKWQILLLGELDNREEDLITLSKFRRGLVRISKIKSHKAKCAAYDGLRQGLQEEAYNRRVQAEKVCSRCQQVQEAENWGLSNEEMEKIWQDLTSQQRDRG